MFFEIQSAELEADDRPIEVAPAPPRNHLSRRQSHSKLTGSGQGNSVLDQIKRSAGNTPAFKSSERRSKNTIIYSKQVHEYDTENSIDDEYLNNTGLYNDSESDEIHQNDTDNGYADFGAAQHTASFHPDFKLVPNQSFKTATTADDSTYILQNHTNEFTSFFFDQDYLNDRNNNDDENALIESEKKSHVSTNSSRSMSYFSAKRRKQPPPTESEASASNKRFSPFKNIIGPAERMLRLLDGPISTQQQQQQVTLQTPSPIQPHDALVMESPDNLYEPQQSPVWYTDHINNDDATYSGGDDDDGDDDEEEREGEGEFGEPISLLDVEDNDDEYGDEDDDDDQTYSDSYTQAYTNNNDDGSYYDTDEYDDDDTFLTLDDEYDEYYDEHDKTGLHPDSMAVNSVESFLDELAEVEDVQDLGTLLYQVGSCNFQGIGNTARNKGLVDNEDDDEYTVTSDAFPNMKQDFDSIPILHSNPTTQPTSHQFWSPTQFYRKKAAQISEDHRRQSPFKNTGDKKNYNGGHGFIDGTTDTVAQILHSMSISTESMYSSILGASSSDQVKTPPPTTTESNSLPPSKNTAATPNNANQSFFQSIFSCHG